MQEIVKSYGTDRKRISAALEYFDEKGWIELSAKQATDVFDVLDQSFDVETVADKMSRVFREKERFEIGRIHDMIRFFESDTCLSRNLADHFGDNIKREACGHCSVCRKGRADILRTQALEPLDGQSFQVLSDPFKAAVGDQFSLSNLTRFLCGIYTPAFARLKIKDVPHFGELERYPFLEVKKWAGVHLDPSA
jgi:ATP-dependent DNA helicase RecQ